MGVTREPYQGVKNIVRFNWHFYLIFILLSPLLLVLLNVFLSLKISLLIILLLVIPVFVSLVISHWIYDRSVLYELNFMDEIDISERDSVININAGFDETSRLLLEKLPGISLKVFDFYNPKTHTEPSIKRARKAYPPYEGTRAISTSKIPLEDASVDVAILMLSAHEIRQTGERLVFFKEVYRALKFDGHLVVVEHLRDLPNFLAYTIGFFHFFSRKSWMTIFEKSNFELSKEIKITPFVSTFILKKHGTSS